MKNMRKCLKFSIKTIILYLVFLLFLNSKLIAGISPFGSALLFALGFVFPTQFFILPAYCFANLTLGISIQSTAVCLANVSFCLLNMVLTKKIKFPYRQFLLVVCVLLSQIPYLLFNSGVGQDAMPAFISVFLCYILIYLYIIIFNAYNSRGLQTTFTIDENIGLFAIMLPLMLGLYNVEIISIQLHVSFFCLGLLMLNYIKNGTFALVFSIVTGLGIAFSTGEILPMASFCCLAIAVIASGRLNKFLSVIVFIVADFILGKFFVVYETYNLFRFLSVAIGCVLFLSIPRKLYNKLFCYLSYEKICFSNSFLIDSNKLMIKSKLLKISKIFQQLNNVYKKMIIGEMDKNEVALVLTDDVTIKTCNECEKKNSCFREKNDRTKQQILSVVENGIIKGKISLVDIPSGLSMCHRINTLMAQINQNIVQYHQYEGLVAREDKNKLAVGNQFFGISEILDKIAFSLGRGKRVDERTEKELIDEFLYNNIIVRECLITEDETGLDRAVVIIKNNKYRIDDILCVSDKFFKTRTKVVDNRFSEISGWKIITIAKAPRFKLVFGCSSIGKNGSKQNGDSYTYINLGNNKYLLGLSDGKGSGLNAETTSNLSIGLIEDFYQAGFSTEIIMQNVNRVLAFNNKENFSAVDVCVFDTELGYADFIKVGSSPSAIKRKNKVEIIEAESLPLGILESTKQSLFKKSVSSGDVVVLVSDGVYDAFWDNDDFSSFINNNNLINMQMFAENIMEEAITRYKGEIKDDMTVLTIRAIFDR